jgi:hypothetical protein
MEAQMTLARSSTCNSEPRAESSAKPDETGNAYRVRQPLRPPPIAPSAAIRLPAMNSTFLMRRSVYG